MKIFQLIIKGNDIFVWHHEIHANTFYDAYEQGMKWLEGLKGRTIEQLRITRIEELN